MAIRWIAWRLIKEIFRDKRTLLFFFIAPLVVMTLVYYALLDSEPSKLTVVARGPSRLFIGEFISALEKEEDVRITSQIIPDDLIDETKLQEAFTKALKEGKTDGILYLESSLIDERVVGKRGKISLYVEGARPLITGKIVSSIAEAMDELTEALPAIGDENCSSQCLDSVNTKSIELVENYLHTSKDYDQIDYYLPMFPAFFAFFFTFITVSITFQRERLGGTLERLLTAPISFKQIILGYMGGFLLFAIIQSTIILTFIFNLIETPMDFSQYGAIIVVTVLTLFTALLLGLFASYFSASEFQAMQFIPLVILPQVFLSDMIWDIHDFPKFFQFLANLMPLTYANRMIRDAVTRNHSLWGTWPSMLALLGFCLFLLTVLIIVNKKKTRF